MWKNFSAQVPLLDSFAQAPVCFDKAEPHVMHVFTREERACLHSGATYTSIIMLPRLCCLKSLQCSALL